MAFQGQRILIVGGAGFIGSNLAGALITHAPKEILIIDNLLSAEQENLPQNPAVTFVKGSITDNEMLDSLKDDLAYIFHLATYHGNQSSIHDPLADHEHSALTTLKLYDAIKEFKTPLKVVYSSAGCTIAEKTTLAPRPTTEDDPISLHLDSPYQISKVMGEFYSNYYHLRHGLPVVTARFQNVYGPGEVLGAGAWRGTPATVWRNVIPTFIYRALKGMPLRVEGTGQNTRDFIFVDDVVRGLMLCAIDGKAGEVYNLASGEETSILEVANYIDDIVKNPAPLEFVPGRDWDHSGRRFGSTEKAAIELGFQAEIDLVDGLRATVDWTRDTLSFIESCIEKHANYLVSS